jgi:hypothetical protein
MTLNKAQKASLTCGLAALAALATGGMAMGPPDHPVRMSGLRMEGLSGYVVVDRAGAKVGEIIKVEADRIGRTRWLDIALDAGGAARVASFRAFLDAPRRQIAVSLSEDLLISRGDQAEAEDRTTSPSA